MTARAPVRECGETMDMEKELIEQRAQIKMLEAKLQALQDVLSREGIIEDDMLSDELGRIIKHGEHKQ